MAYVKIVDGEGNLIRVEERTTERETVSSVDLQNRIVDIQVIRQKHIQDRNLAIAHIQALDNRISLLQAAVVDVLAIEDGTNQDVPVEEE